MQLGEKRDEAWFCIDDSVRSALHLPPPPPIRLSLSIRCWSFSRCTPGRRFLVEV